MIEIWKDIKGYEGLYQVSNLGRVKSYTRKVENRTNDVKGIFISQRVTSNGYYRVRLNKNAKRKDYFVHVLVAENFIRTKKHGETVNHINFDKLDNAINNLEIVGHSENLNHNYFNYKNKKASIILNTESGIFSPSINEASRTYNINARTLRDAILRKGEYRGLTIV